MQLDLSPKEEKPQIENFVHLHLHTIYSTLDGMCKIKPLAKKAKELGMTAVAISDHGHVGGTVAFQDAMKDAGIKPILGMEAYTTEDMQKEALSAEARTDLAILDIMNNSIADTCNWDITKRKAERKPAEYYYKKVASNIKDTKIEDIARAKEIVKEASVKDLPFVHKAFSKDEINAFKRLNKKIFETYSYDVHQYHLILLAMNQQGWKNLICLQSIAARDCRYNGRFLMDKKLLKQYNEGIICTSACVGNHISKLVQRRKLDEAEQEILQYVDIFRDRFYLEIQPLTIPQQIVTNAFYLQMHQKHHIPVVATSDVHYINKEDWDIHDTYLCIAMGRLKDDKLDKEVYMRTHKNDKIGKGWKPRMRYTNDFWFRTKEEMVDAFLHQEEDSEPFFKNEPNPLQTKEYRDFWVEALNTTNEVARRIDSDILIGSPTTLYPKVKNLPKGFNSDQWLLAEAMDGLVKYDKKMREAGTPINFQQYANKILDEMAVISTKHYSDYFLCVQEYINWANSINPETNLPYACTGPGRGSAAGSLVLFLVGITHNIDPIKYNLMFSRFLTMDRNEPPDYLNSRVILKEIA